MRARWSILAAAALAVLALLTVWQVRAARSGGVARATARSNAAVDPAALAADPRLRDVLRLAQRKSDPKAWEELVSLYGRLAGDPSAFGVRTAVLNALFNEPVVGLRIKRALDAVEADHTPPPQDPLWPELVQRLAQEWSGELLPKGRDLMLMEKRSRAQRALIASLAEVAGSERAAELTAEEARGLLEDLIDMHARAAPDQRPQIQEAVRKLGGNDPADLLAGQGLKGGKKLELQAEYERNLQAGVDSLLNGQAPQD